MCFLDCPIFLGWKNATLSTFCVHQAFGHVIWCFHQGKIYIFVGWCGFSSCPHQDSQWFLFHQGPEMVETHWKWFYTLWHSPKVHNNLFNSEKILNHSEKKLPEIIHVKLQTIMPLRVFEFFPYSRVVDNFPDACQVWLLWCSPLWGAGGVWVSDVVCCTGRCSDIWTLLHYRSQIAVLEVLNCSR